MGFLRYSRRQMIKEDIVTLQETTEYIKSVIKENRKLSDNSFRTEIAIRSVINPDDYIMGLELLIS
jgi:hypothetical protein